MFSTLDNFFQITSRGSTVKRELIGGATTFATMAYIIVVNPAILQFAGLPIGASTIATILTAVFGCSLMALFANMPLAIAPYMGENAFIAFGLAAMGITWEERLGAVFIGGLAFLLFSFARVRPWLAKSISPSLRCSFGVGIGLFLALIGMYETGVVTSGAEGLTPQSLLAPGGNLLRAPDIPLKIGNLHDPHVLLTIVGFFLTVTLLARKVPAAILIGIAVTGIMGVALGYGDAPHAVMALPFVAPYDLSATFLKLDICGDLQLRFLPILITLFLMGFLDTLGTLVGVAAAAEMVDSEGNVTNIERPMIVDAVSCMFSALVGTSTSGAFVESAAGIREGARTGLASIMTALLFALSLFFIPLLEPLQTMKFAYAPSLIAVGLLMLTGLRRINLEDLTEAVPAFATIATMVFTYNIANGLMAGLVLHPALKLVTGRAKDLNAGSVVLGVICALYFVFGVPH